MIELVFVIVVLGILASIAVPRLAATRDDAILTKARSDIAAIRSAIINERQTRLFRGDPSFITSANLDSGGLFGGVLPYPLPSGTDNGKWSKSGSTYQLTIFNTTVNFDYNATSGTFNCSGTHCDTLTH